MTAEMLIWIAGVAIGYIIGALVTVLLICGGRDA